MISLVFASCVRWKQNLWLGQLPFQKITLSFSGLKRSSQTLAGPCMSPWESRHCLDLVYLVFNQREARMVSEEEGKNGGQEQKTEEGKGGYPTLSYLLCSALWQSKEFPSFSNFSKAAVMTCEAAIKNNCFYILFPFLLEGFGREKPASK